MADLSPVLRAYCDLHVPEVREYCGRHEYDGKLQDLSPAGVQIMDLRDRARHEWGAGFTLRRFHAAMFSLGSPTLGSLGTAIEAG
jgi:hypothetical protein